MAEGALLLDAAPLGSIGEAKFDCTEVCADIGVAVGGKEGVLPEAILRSTVCRCKRAGRSRADNASSGLR